MSNENVNSVEEDAVKKESALTDANNGVFFALMLALNENLPQPLLTYRLIKKLVASEENTGKLSFYYVMKGFSVEEVRRLQNHGWDITRDDVVFREGAATFGLQVAANEKNFNEKERHQIREVRSKFKESKRNGNAPLAHTD